MCVLVVETITAMYPHKAFAPAIIGMSGQIHVDFLRLLWVLADKQMWSYYESMGKEDKIGNEAFRWARAKVFNSNKTSVLVGLLPLAAPPAAICLCTVLRCLARVRVMPPREQKQSAHCRSRKGGFRERPVTELGLLLQWADPPDLINHVCSLTGR